MTTTIHIGKLVSFEGSEPSGGYGVPLGARSRRRTDAGWTNADATGASPIPTVQG